MISVPPDIGSRKVFYLAITDSLHELREAHLTNWAVFVIEDNINNPILSEFADVCIEKDLLYMCATGKACSEIDDLFDMNMVMRGLDGKPLPLWHTNDDDVLMTTWHHNLEEGFWFCATQTTYDDQVIDKVLVANLTDTDYFPKISKLTKLISEGWLPPD